MQKNSVIFSLLIALVAVSSLAGASTSEDITFQNIKKIIDERYGSGNVPDSVNALFGNERINLNIDNVVVGLALKGGKIVEIKDGGIDNPSANITISKGTAEKIIASDNPEAALKAALKGNEIQIKGIGAVNWLKYAITQLLMKIAAFFGY